MDSSHHHHQNSNWLTFSLSNHHHFPSDPTSHLSLFEAFNSSNHCGGGGERHEEVPKLEDFLGGGLATGAADVCHFSGGAAGIVSESGIYDSELKSIAASFLRGFAADQTDTQQQLAVVVAPPEPVAKKAVDTFGQRTSIYRGVTRHRWTGRYEAHLWDNSCRREGQSRKGRQVYLGGYDKEDKAARAYDLAALKYWGPTTTTNFPVSNYEKELVEMKNMTRQEFVASLRRKSSGFSRGASIYRGVTRHHQHGRWQARIGRVAGNKDLYLGTFSTQEEAAEAYDIAAIKFRGLNAVTNFDMSRYDVKSIANSNLPVGGASGKSKTSSDSDNKSLDGDHREITSAPPVTFASQPLTSSSTLSFGLPTKQDSTDHYWSSLLGYNHANKTSSTQFHNGTTLQSTTPFSMDFTTNATTSCTTVSEGGINHHNGYFNNGYLLQQSNGTSNFIPFAAPIALNGTHSYDGSSFGNWVGPSLHSFQPAKPNLSVFQTPIFGIE